MKNLFFSIIFIGLLSYPSFGKIIHVPAEFTTIQQGINNSVDGDSVLVADGTYTGEGNKNIDFYGKKITVRSEHGAEYTVIDCEGNGRGFNFHMNENASSILNGFEIKNGKNANGGGIYCSNSSPKIMYCNITENSSAGYFEYGGGIYCNKSCPIILHCNIVGNSAKCGGGVFTVTSSPTIAFCNIKENIVNEEGLKGGSGGGVEINSDYQSPPVISDCTITDNYSDGGGGGIHCHNSSLIMANNSISNNYAGQQGGGISMHNASPTIRACQINGNYSDYDGGGIYCDASSSTISDCIINGNFATDLWGSGGGLAAWESFLSVTNCTITENSVADQGGGIHCSTSMNGSSSLLIENCLFSKNVAINPGGGIYCDGNSFITIKNAIFWNDLPNEIDVFIEYPEVSYSDIEGGWSGTGNIDMDPLFVNPSNRNFHLQSGSPCIDKGDPDSPNVPWGGSRIDMGSFEFDKGFYLDENGHIIRKPITNYRTRFNEEHSESAG